MSGNRLTTPPSGIFDKLTALESLGLQDNQLTALPSGIFDKLAALEWLWLDNNRLTALPSGIFDNLTGLYTLNLHSNRLAGLTSGHPLLRYPRFRNLDVGSVRRFGPSCFYSSRIPDLTNCRGFYLGDQQEPPSPPPCQPNGGFPSCPEGEPEPPAPEPGEPEPPAPEPGDPEPEPPALEPGDLAGRLAAAEMRIAALSDRLEAAIEALQTANEALAGESREADAAHAERLDAIEENMPPRRLRLWVPAQDGELVETPIDE